MKWQYLPKNRNARLAWLQCELTEASHAIAKVNRWGAHSRNPDKEPDPLTNPVNMGELLFEIWDIEAAVQHLMPDIVRFLTPELVENMRAHWLSLAIPPDTTQQDVPPDTALKRKCMVCEGTGRVRKELDGRTLVDGCAGCEGTGFINAEEGQVNG